MPSPRAFYRPAFHRRGVDRLAVAALAWSLRSASRKGLSGGGIVNGLRYACLKPVVRRPREIRARDLLQGIRKELQKEGKFLGQSR